MVKVVSGNYKHVNLSFVHISESGVRWKVRLTFIEVYDGKGIKYILQDLTQKKCSVSKSFYVVLKVWGYSFDFFIL